MGRDRVNAILSLTRLRCGERCVIPIQAGMGLAAQS